jgi:hypothetical protein
MEQLADSVDYYRPWVLQYILYVPDKTATANHGIITLMGDAQGTSPAPAPAPAPAPEPEPEPTHQLKSTDSATSAPTQAGGTINITGGEPNGLLI